MCHPSLCVTAISVSPLSLCHLSACHLSLHVTTLQWSLFPSMMLLKASCTHQINTDRSRQSRWLQLLITSSPTSAAATATASSSSWISSGQQRRNTTELYKPRVREPHVNTHTSTHTHTHTDQHTQAETWTFPRSLSTVVVMFSRLRRLVILAVMELSIGLFIIFIFSRDDGSISGLLSGTTPGVILTLYHRWWSLFGGEYTYFCLITGDISLKGRVCYLDNDENADVKNNNNNNCNNNNNNNNT